MTTAVKPIIKLPPRSNRSNSISVKPVEISIYFEDQENKLSDVDIQNLLQDFAPVQIKRERGGGYLSFQDTKIAEKVYSFYNGYVFTNNVIFKLSLNDSQQPEGPLLEIRNLPQSIDHHQLFELCRPFGSLHICKVIKEEGNIKKRALVQYFRKQDSDSSQINLNNKTIEGSTIQVAILMPSNLTHHRSSVSQEKNESSGYIDYMNLYVKNLDPTIGNTELFSLFRKFGHIVSARVMSNPATGLSKGYGFVSYSKPEEAALALNEMNGIMVRSKAMVVAYHEPKKPRQEKSSSTTTSSFHSPPSTAPPVDYGTVPYFETRHPHEAILGPGIEPVDPLNLKELSLNPTVPMQRKLSFADLPYRTPHFTQRPSLASILPSHLERVPEEDHRRRKGSVESVMTESSAHLQKIKMTEAVKRCGSFGPELKHIVDMLLTLKKRERSLCLFNSDFLKEKINAAIEALEVFDEDEEEEEVIVRKPSIRNIPEHIIPPPRISKAIPIVAPPSPEETAKMAEIKKLLSSFEGKPIHERKQLLGDQLFPLVKATGVRHAPKITIRLLDTIELEELAKIMFNKELLKVQVNKVA